MTTPATTTAVHVVYAHPSERSFTREVLDAFLDGLADAGRPYTVSDLYAMDFHSELTRAEYERESGYDAEAPVPEDVAAEQARLAAADTWVFVYPVWWADCPARLKGWFDRVWTVGFARRTVGGPRVAEKALVLCTAGYDIAELEASGCYRAMRTVMLTDRIGERARASEFVVLGGSASASASGWQVLKGEHLARVKALARSV
ncbi:NAD(P)H-dependent oxidoreductase [Streptomyces sp. NPDC047981]|uniref:NAD(P)H-dependent oxidoreductase n=1 Tax=Streptomyces sp. NPDC047981 TaxID=3154610 RepID=UPI0034181C2B